MKETNITVEVPSLVLEITRRCNMHCDHCIRGCAQNMDITDDVLEYVAKYVQPSEVTFSGGEPSLNVPAITRYFELAEKYEHMPSSFYVITNGKQNQEELAMALLRAYGKMDEPDMCGVAVSRDIFHDKSIPEASILRGLSFLQDSHSHPLNERDPQWVIDTGRAADTGWGVRSPYEISEFVEDMIEETWVRDGNPVVMLKDILYVGANGLAADQCDISYDQLDEGAICHIKDLPDKLLQSIYREACA